LNILAWILVIIGAINWGLIGFFQFDLVAAIFGGQGAVVSRIIYGVSRSRRIMVPDAVPEDQGQRPR